MKVSAPAKEKNSIYDNEIDETIDLMAASVIPLFYAADQNKELLSSFLKKYSKTNQEAKKIIDHYFKVLEDLHMVFQTTFKKKIVSYKIEVINLTKKINNDYKVYQRACEKYKLVLDRLKKDNELLNPQDFLIIKTIHDLNQKINLLFGKKRLLESTIQYLGQSKSHEIILFIEEVMLFTLNFADGPTSLNQYFQSRPEIVNFLLENREVFNKVATAWMEYTIYLPIKNHPLPMYLCPFNASEAQFNHKTGYNITSENAFSYVETTYERTDNSYNSHFASTKNNKLPLLAMRMQEIQSCFPKSESNLEDAALGAPIRVNEQTFFKPTSVRRVSDDSHSSEPSESSSGRSTSAERMFASGS